MRISSTLTRVLVIALLTLALGLAPAIPAQASSGDSAGWFSTLIGWVLGVAGDSSDAGNGIDPIG